VRAVGVRRGGRRLDCDDAGGAGQGGPRPVRPGGDRATGPPRGTDKKWTELCDLLLDEAAMSPDGSRPKIIVFTEHRDTLNYLVEQIRGLLGPRRGGRRDPRRRRPRGSAHGAGALHPGQGHRRPGRDRRGGGGAKPPAPARACDGQLRSTTTCRGTQPPGAALRAHPSHRPDRGVPPVEPGRDRHA
jgi:hypothetical protein